MVWAPTAGPARSATYGASGVQIQDGTGNVPSTDPALAGTTNFLAATRVAYYDGPGLGVTDAGQRHDWVAKPVVASTAAWPGVTGPLRAGRGEV